MRDDGIPSDGTSRWLPDFCDLPVVAAVMLVAELVVLVIVLSPSPQGFSFDRLLYATVFGEWLALCCLVCLCRLRPWWRRLAPVPGVVAVLFAVTAIAALASVLVKWIDTGAGLGLTEADGG